MAKKTPLDIQGIDKAIEHVLNDMQGMDADDPKFAAAVQQLKILVKIRNPKTEPFLTPAQWFPPAMNLLGLGLILAADQVKVLSKNALSFLMKNR